MLVQVLAVIHVCRWAHMRQCATIYPFKDIWPHHLYKVLSATFGSHFSFSTNGDQDPLPIFILRYCTDTTYMENWGILQKLSFSPLSPSSLRHIQLIMHSTVQTSYCWVIYEAVNIELVSSLGLLQIKLLWTFMYKLCENEVSFLWDGSLSVWLLVHFF